MDSVLLKYLVEQWVGIVILWVGGWYVIKYFMSEIRRKEDQNQSNLDKFIDLVKEWNLINTKIFEALDNTIPAKLNDIHVDVKAIAQKRTYARKV